MLRGCIIIQTNIRDTGQKIDSQNRRKHLIRNAIIIILYGCFLCDHTYTIECCSQHIIKLRYLNESACHRWVP